MIVRELLATFGLSFDPSGFNRADQAMSGLAARAQKLAAGFLTIAGARIGFDIARDAAQFEDAKRIFDATGESLDELREKSKGILSDKTLVTQRNLARQFGITKDQFVEFIGISDAAAKTLGRSQKYVFESLITGTARKSKPILDNAGVLLETEAALNKFAAKRGKKASDLSDLEERQAVAEAVLEQGRKIVAGVKNVKAVTSDVFDQWDSQLENLKTSGGALANVFLAQVLPALLGLMKRAQSLAETLTVAAKKAQNFTWIARRLGEVLMFLAVRAFVLFALRVRMAVLQLLLWITTSVAAAAAAAFQATWNVHLATGYGALTASIVMARNALLSFVASIFGSAAVTGTVILVLLGIIALLGEEIAAMFSDTDGLFEQMSGKWDDLRDSLLDGVDANEWWIVQAARFAMIVIADLFDVLDTATMFWIEAGAAAFDAMIDGASTLYGWIDTLTTPLQIAARLFNDLVSAPLRLGQALKDGGFGRFGGFLSALSPTAASGAQALGFAQSVTAPTATIPTKPNASGPQITNAISVTVDASGQSFDEATLTDKVRGAVRQELTNANREAVRSLTPSKASP